MADQNVVIKRNNAGTIDNVYPQTTWTNVLSKPSTFTPTAHTHTVSDITSFVDNFKATTTTSSSTTPVSAITLTLAANSYYQLAVDGMWSKSWGGTGTWGTIVSMAVNNTTGTPTWSGAFEWAASPTATAYTIESENSNLTTSTTAHGFSAGVSGATVSASYFAIKGLIYTGTSEKVLTFYVAQTATFTGGAVINNIVATALKVN
jgi:hypothetical protein